MCRRTATVLIVLPEVVASEQPLTALLNVFPKS